MSRKKKFRLPRVRWTRKPTTQIHDDRHEEREEVRRGGTMYEEQESPHDGPRYCSVCGAELSEAIIDGVKRRRCSVCGNVAYRNPVPAAGVVVERDGGVVLVKRKYEPKVGLWSLPAGFMEYDETPEECAVRETLEETGMTVSLVGLIGVYAAGDDPRTRAVLIVYRAVYRDGEPAPGDDASEIAIAPWDRLDEYPLAFAAHRRALDDARSNP
jgi:8-oxo-dGTP diphosphatase